MRLLSIAWLCFSAGCGSAPSLCEPSRVVAVSRAEDLPTALTLTCGAGVPPELRPYLAGEGAETLDAPWSERCGTLNAGGALWEVETAVKQCAGVGAYRDLDTLLSLEEPRAGVLTWDWLKASGVEDAVARSVADRIAGGLVLPFPSDRAWVPWAAKGERIARGSGIGVSRRGLRLDASGEPAPVERAAIAERIAAAADQPVVLQVEGDLPLGALEPVRIAAQGVEADAVWWVVQSRDAEGRSVGWRVLPLYLPAFAEGQRCRIIADLRPEGLWFWVHEGTQKPVRVTPAEGCPADGPTVCLPAGGLRPTLDALAVAEGGDRARLRAAVMDAWPWSVVEERASEVRKQCPDGVVELRGRASVTADLVTSLVSRLGNARVEWTPTRR